MKCTNCEIQDSILNIRWKGHEYVKSNEFCQDCWERKIRAEKMNGCGKKIGILKFCEKKHILKFCEKKHLCYECTKKLNKKKRKQNNGNN